MTKRETAAEIERQVAEWLIRLDAAGSPPEVEAEFQRWLGGDDRRRGAALRAEAAWYLLDQIGDPQTVDLQAPASEASAFRNVAASSSILSRRRLLIGGSVALAASLAGWICLPPGVEYSTSTGELRRVPLPDGSIASINTASRIHVQVEPRARLVSLDRGEAWFQVAKDKSRPFIVEAGLVRARAVGTAFSVRRFDNGTDIVVTEGVVQVWTVGKEAQPVHLVAGEQAFVANNALIRRDSTPSTDVERTLAWREGLVDLAGDRLEDAAANFNRYNLRQIVITDRSLANERFYGVFKTEDVEGFAEAIQSSLGAKIDRSDPAVIRIGA